MIFSKPRFPFIGPGHAADHPRPGANIMADAKAAVAGEALPDLHSGGVPVPSTLAPGPSTWVGDGCGRNPAWDPAPPARRPWGTLIWPAFC